jgi:hypothetical protein
MCNYIVERSKLDCVTKIGLKNKKFRHMDRLAFWGEYYSRNRTPSFTELLSPQSTSLLSNKTR